MGNVRLVLCQLLKSRGGARRRQRHPTPVLLLGKSHGRRSLVVEGVPDLPGAHQDEASLTRKFETSHVGSHQVPLSMGILQARILGWVAISFRGSS